jgi:hypothetical protein
MICLLLLLLLLALLKMVRFLHSLMRQLLVSINMIWEFLIAHVGRWVRCGDNVVSHFLRALRQIKTRFIPFVFLTIVGLIVQLGVTELTG